MMDACAFCKVGGGLHTVNCIWVKAALVETDPAHDPWPLDVELRLRKIEAALKGAKDAEA